MTNDEFQVATPPEGRKQFGRYTLLYRFAAGGMANLYVASLAGADGFAKRVAVKVIHEHLVNDPEFVKMFIDEARIASRISHPNVAQTIELGRYGKTHFMAMEYVEGESLNSILRRTRPVPPVCARIIANAAAGLHAAHELRGQDGELLNVVHRDVSPQNILISYDGAVKVVDFGVARARGRLHTTSGGVKGKISYMAPEQISAPTEVDRRADIFALGILLFESSTRQRLITGENEGVKIERLLRGGFPRPSEKLPDYPAELERIVMRALAQKPEDRYATAQELSEALERFIVSSGAPVMQTDLAALMRQLFAERMAKKQRLDTRADPETSAVLDVDLVSLPGRPPPAPEPRRRRLGLFVALAGSALLLGLATTAFVLAYRSSSTASDPARPDAAPLAPDLRPPRPDLATLRPAPTIHISVRARPASATIRFDGKPVANPFTLDRPAAAGSVEVLVSAPRHHSQRITVPLSSGGEWSVTLKRKRRAVPPAGHKGGKKPGDLRDEDVFSNPYQRKKQ